MLIKSCLYSQPEEGFQRLIFQAITSVDLSSGSNFTKGNDSLLLASLRSSFVQEEYPRPPTENGEEGWPLPPSRCNADLKGGAVLWSLSHTQQAHPEIFILLSNTLSPRRRGNGKNLNQTRHFVEVSQSLKESLSSVSYCHGSLWKQKIKGLSPEMLPSEAVREYKKLMALIHRTQQFSII